MVWSPQERRELGSLLRTKLAHDEERAQVRDEVMDVLSRCVSPEGNGDAARTGLVVGYVQSGKTLSFTSLAALARDNYYRLIIVIAGTKIPLYDQSVDRLLGDLNYNRGGGHRWAHFSNLRGDEGALRLSNILDGWRNESVPLSAQRTVLITVMKHSGRIRNLTAVLRRANLVDIPVIVIDDEADQASPNNLVRQARESATNRAINDLRDCLPIHSYLEYTATPQALLLISLAQSLSPDFAKVLEPGRDYVGLSEFFADEERYVRRIPLGDLPNVGRDAPPESLVASLAIFFVGLAIGVLDGKYENRSMLVHPSHLTPFHAQYVAWVRALKRDWEAILSHPNDPDYVHLRGIMHRAYEDLRGTATLPQFDDVMSVMAWCMTSETEIVEMNRRTGVTPSVDWNRSYGHILIGGQAIDRGYTVEGLTVTYMPRSLGVRTADTIQQRARFLGYKREYLGLCRVFLPGDAIAAYEAYDVHEADFREQLQMNGNNIRAWRRRFVLDPGLEPTRRAVLGDPLIRSVASASWVVVRHPYEQQEAVDDNRALFDRFVSEHPFNRDVEGHPAACDLPLRLVLESLLLDYRAPDIADSVRMQAALLTLGEALEHDESLTCDVLRVETGEGWVRQRRLTASGGIDQLFEGPRARYPGDQRARRGERITIQLHRLNLTSRSGTGVAHDVPVVALYVPVLEGLPIIEVA